MTQEWRLAAAAEHERRYGRWGAAGWFSLGCLTLIVANLTFVTTLWIITGKAFYAVLVLLNVGFTALGVWNVHVNRRRVRRACAHAALLRGESS